MSSLALGVKDMTCCADRALSTGQRVTNVRVVIRQLESHAEEMLERIGGSPPSQDKDTAADSASGRACAKLRSRTCHDPRGRTQVVSLLNQRAATVRQKLHLALANELVEVQLEASLGCWHHLVGYVRIDATKKAAHE